METRPSVEHFFNTIATNYRDRLNGNRPFLSYFFNCRLQLATEGLPLEGKKILDVGAGTGALFDYLQNKAISTHYVACDIAAEMLAHSQIPKANRFIGEVSQIPKALGDFDYIFHLGVSSYMPPPKLEEDIKTCLNRLKPEGQLILSFTHYHSLDFLARKTFRPLIKRLRWSKGVIAQPFPIQAYTQAQIIPILPYSTKVAAIKWLPPTLPGLHLLHPRLAVKVSKILTLHLPTGKLKQGLSSDFLLFLKKH